MSIFTSFRGTRFSHGLAGRCAPPYDVMDDSEVRRWRTHNENITHVDVPLADDGPDPYAVAATTWHRWHAEGVVTVDPSPTLTAITMRFRDSRGRDRQVAGVIGAVGLDDTVKGHERTTPKASTDRLDLTTATSANLSPIWALSPARGLTDVVMSVEPSTEVVLDAVTHQVAIIDDRDVIDAVCSLIGSTDLVIADGHHRFGVAQRYSALPDAPAAAGATMMFVNELVDDQLAVDAIHRVYPTIDAVSMAEHLGARGEIHPCGRVDDSVLARMEASRALCILGPDGTGQLFIPDTVGESDRNLDGERLEAILGSVEVVYQHSLDALLGGAIPNGGCAVLIRPVGVDEILRTAATGELMPPKSTFFTPKLATGIVMRDLLLPAD